MRLINADALKEKAVDADYMPTGMWLSFSDLEAAPTVEPKKGEWIYRKALNVFECSVCGSQMVRNIYNYCPWCGAKMKRSEE